MVHADYFDKNFLRFAVAVNIGMVKEMNAGFLFRKAPPFACSQAQFRMLAGLPRNVFQGKSLFSLFDIKAFSQVHFIITHQNLALAETFTKKVKFSIVEIFRTLLGFQVGILSFSLLLVVFLFAGCPCCLVKHF